MNIPDTQLDIKRTIRRLFEDRDNIVFHSILNGMAINVGNYKTPISVSVADSGYVSGYFHKEVWDNCTPEQKDYLLIKEALRLLLEHPVRRPDSEDKAKWKKASDMLIDDTMNRYMDYTSDAFGKLALPLLPSEFNGRCTIEDVYKWVKEQPEDEPQPNNDPNESEADGEGKATGQSNKKGKAKAKAKPEDKADDKSDGEEKSDDVPPKKDNKSDKEDDGDNKDKDKSENGKPDDSNSNSDSNKENGEGDQEDESDESDEDSNGEEPEDAPDDVSKTGLQSLMENTADRSGINEQVETISKQAGSEQSTLMREYERKKIVKKPRWDKVIKVWTRETIMTGPEETWTRKPIHLDSLLTQLNGRIPGVRTVEQSKNKGKVPVVCYADVSGSCTSYFQRFMAAALTIPLDKFDVHLRSFDTVVRVLERKKMKTPAGGGTDVRPVVRDYYQLKQQIGKDLHCFVITDGYFSLPEIKEEDRKMFHWFLTNESTDQWIPKGCKVYKLEDFE